MTQEMCRLCLSESNLSPIFVNSEKHERYTAVLVLTTGLNIEPNDEFSQLICANCIELVNSFRKFRNKCHLSHIRLLKEKTKESLKTRTISDGSSNSNNNEFAEELIANCDDTISSVSEFQIEVEFQRVTESEESKQNGGDFGGKFDFKDGGSSENSGNGIEHNKSSINKPMSRKERRERYLELVDGELDPKGPVKCKVCKKTVSKWSCFISHAKLHLGFKFMCEYCAKSFISSTQLKRHCRSHHGMKRELKCKHCSYLALDTAQLVLHERRVHTGERPFVCDTCGASYHSRRCLLQHTLGHRTTATEQCESCPLKFKSSRHLARHRYSAHTRKARMKERPP